MWFGYTLHNERSTLVMLPSRIMDDAKRSPLNELDRYSQFLERHPELTADAENMLTIFPDILELQAQKSAVYGRSYCRHGDLSIFLNVERKWDRISNIMNAAMKTGTDQLYESGTPTETFLDTVVDLASYSLLWVGYIKENHPELYQKFLEANSLTNTQLQRHMDV